MKRMKRKSKSQLSVFVAVILLVGGCVDREEGEVVVLSALDREFSAPIFADAEHRLDLPLRIKYDVESNKTVGLANQIIRNRQRPVADLFWNNEILHTLRLKNLGLLQCVSPIRATQLPGPFVSATGHWFGFAARARVLIVNTDLMPDANSRPQRFEELANKAFAGKCTLARPLFGTSATHAAVMFDVLGDQSAEKLYRSIQKNAVVQGGNKQVAQKVAAGEFLFGLTDTDDALIELDSGQPVTIIFPNQGVQELGTLLIPNTLCVIKNGPNTPGAVRLINQLLSAETEQRLAMGPSGQIPLAIDVATKSRVVPSSLKVMEVDFESAANRWQKTAAALKSIFPLGQ
jgi:iron(III) transport system substrate-binding protein